jgi:hypothetical protein
MGRGTLEATVRVRPKGEHFYYRDSSFGLQVFLGEILRFLSFLWGRRGV